MQTFVLSAASASAELGPPELYVYWPSLEVLYQFVLVVFVAADCCRPHYCLFCVSEKDVLEMTWA